MRIAVQLQGTSSRDLLRQLPPVAHVDQSVAVDVDDERRDRHRREHRAHIELDQVLDDGASGSRARGGAFVVGRGLTERVLLGGIPSDVLRDRPA